MRRLIIEFTPAEAEPDPIDGSTDTPVREAALRQIAREEHELTDLEVVTRAVDEYWFYALCLETLHRLPSEINPIIGCREYQRLKAWQIVKSCYDRLARAELKRGGSAPE